jgi:cyanophycinase-like exopeptidase
MKKITMLFLLSIQCLFAQNYVEYHTGSTVDAITNQQPGVCMMGGASEQDDAMIWFLNQADGGDVVVLRASGSDGYNDYFYTDLGVTINSVTTFVIDNVAGATDPYVLERVANAEAIWFAGGDQWDYVSYFKDNDMEDTLNNFINVKQGVIGGTSAGMAILGSSYFSAQYGTLTSNVAQGNPYHPRVALGYNDFLTIPYLENVITDSHYDDPDRRGRHSVFLARFSTDNGARSYGIACNEYTAVCIGADGRAYVYGEYPAYDEFAYFLQANCVENYQPETCVANTPLDWNRGGEAIKVYRVPGTEAGTNYFDLSDWETGSGGEWQNWSVTNGTFATVAGVNPECGALSIEEVEIFQVEVYPNPFSDRFYINMEGQVKSMKLYTILGKEINLTLDINKPIDASSLSLGMYILKLKIENQVQTFKLIKR